MNIQDLLTRDFHTGTAVATGGKWFARELPTERAAIEAIATLCAETLRLFPDAESYRDWASAQRFAAFDAEQQGARIPANIAPRPSGFVYLMRDNRSGFYKIGWSKNPAMREHTLLAQTPDVALVWNKEGTKSDEKSLHARYSHLRIRGEWFQLTATEIAEITEDPE